MTNSTRYLLLFGLVGFLSLSGVATSFAAYTTEQELGFAETLALDWRMADFAGKVLDELEQKLPATEKQNVVPSRVIVLAASGKLPAAEELVKTMATSPVADEALIALAKAYYRANNIQKAKEIYADYFKRHTEPPKEKLKLRAFQTACSQFGAMMKAAGEYRAAVTAGRMFLKTGPDEEIADAIRCDMAVMLIEAAKKETDAAKKTPLLQECDKLCDEVLKHGVNLFFAQALVAKANAKLLQGDRAGAVKLIKTNMDVLQPLDDFLRENNRISESPIPGVRMLYGQIHEEDGRAALAKKDNKTAEENFKKAISEYINVFIKYGDSDYGLPAGTKANEIKKILSSAPFNRTVKWEMTREQQEQMLAHSFQLADQKVRERDFEKAIAEYLKVLKEYPESDRSVRALGSLLRSYAENDDKLMVKATATYIGERFHTRPFAADLIRGLGKFYIDKKDEQMFNFVCETYLTNFPKDQNAAAVLYTLATLDMQNNNFAAAIPVLEKIVKGGYTNDANYSRALGDLARISMQASNYAVAAESYQIYADSLFPGIDKVFALTKVADALRLDGKQAAALPIYSKVVGELSNPQGGWDNNAETKARAHDLLERCTFFTAICYSRAAEPTDDTRQKAIAAFEEFVKKFPNSTNYAPKALAGRGQVYLQADKFDDAFKVFQELSQRYPNSPEGKNALISLVQSALEIKKLDQARTAFKQMMAAGQSVSVSQYLQIGQLWLDNQIYPEAAQAFQKVVESKTTDKNLLQPALFGLGRAEYENKKYKEGAAALGDLLKKFERTPYYFDASLTVSACYREIGQFKEAMDALSDTLLQPSSTPVQRMRAQFEIAQLQEKQGEKQKALASYLRVVDLAALKGESNPELLSWIEKCALEGIRVGAESQKYADVVNLCEEYEKLLPRGAKLADVRKAKADAVSKAASLPAPVQEGTSAGKTK